MRPQIAPSVSMVWAGKYQLEDDNLDKETIGDIMKIYETDFVMIGNTKYEPTKKDRNLTFRQFMKQYNIDLIEVRECGIIHRCRLCHKSDVPFSKPWAVECKPCHATYMREWRADKKERSVDEIFKDNVERELTTLRKEILRITRMESELNTLKRAIEKLCIE
jgi:hypothetical protein